MMYFCEILLLELNCNNINSTNFPAPDAHFDNTCLFSDARGQNIEIQSLYKK